MSETPENTTTLADVQREATGAHVEAAEAHAEAAEANIAATDAAQVLRNVDAGTDRLADIQREATGAHVEAAEANIAASEAARVLKGEDADRLAAVQRVAALAHDDAQRVKEDLAKADRNRRRSTRVLIAVGAIFLIVLVALLGMVFYVANVANANQSLNKQVRECITAGAPCYERSQAHDRAIRDDILQKVNGNGGKLDELLSRLPASR